MSLTNAIREMHIKRYLNLTDLLLNSETGSHLEAYTDWVLVFSNFNLLKVIYKTVIITNLHLYTCDSMHIRAIIIFQKVFLFATYSILASLSGMQNLDPQTGQLNIL